MNQKQKRQRINRIRNKQKKSRQAKRPGKRVMTRDDLIDLFTMTRRFARNCQQLVLGRERLLRISAIGGMVSVSIFILFFWAAVSGKILIPKEEMVDILTFTFILSIFPWILYVSLNDRWLLSHWKKEMKDNSDFAEGLRERLQIRS